MVRGCVVHLKCCGLGTWGFLLPMVRCSLLFTNTVSGETHHHVQLLVVTSLEHPEFSGCYEALPSGSQWPCLWGGGKILDFSEFFPLFRLCDGMMLFNPSIQVEDFTKCQDYIYVCKYIKLPLFRVISYEVLYGWTKQKLWIKCWEWCKSLTVWVDSKSTHH